MVEIPTLYEMACRAYSGTWMPGYQEAFDQAISMGEKPIIVLMRVESNYQEIPYADAPRGIIRNPFIWRIAYVDETRFDTYGPLIGSNGTVSQVAIIEDEWDTDPSTPTLRVERCHTLYGWDLYPTPSNYFEERSHAPRTLYAREVFSEIKRRLDLNNWQEPIEGKWFQDAELPLKLIDGVPESWRHSAMRRRHSALNQRPRSGRYHPFYVTDRDYLDDPLWWQALNAAEDEYFESIEVEQMEE